MTFCMFSGMNDLIKKLEQKGIKFENLNALEVFGRGGDWHTTSYANKVKYLEIWEIDSKWENELKRNLPNAKIKIQDSIRTIYDSNNLEKFSFVVIDNPQMLYGPQSENLEPLYCEHFEVLKKIDRIVEPDSIIIFNVNLRPYDYEKWPQWRKRRENFYVNVDTSNINLDFLLNFYKKFFENMNFSVLFYTFVKRKTPNSMEELYYFAYRIKKNHTKI